jgi:hypothetical protein
VADSLNAFTYSERLNAYRAICIIIEDFSGEREERWIPAYRLKEDLGISPDE